MLDECFTMLIPGVSVSSKCETVHHYSENCVATFSTIILAMARLDVAPGDGALRTWSTRSLNSPFPASNTKSSTKFPSSSIACARTPAGPLLYNHKIETCKWTEFRKMFGLHLKKCSAILFSFLKKKYVEEIKDNNHSMKFITSLKHSTQTGFNQW